MKNFWLDYKGGILIVLVFIIMFNLYTNRIQEINSQVENSNIVYYENK